MIKYNYKKNIGSVRTCLRGGFTLLEALVAVSILMVAVVAPITIAQKGLSSAVYTKNQMIASYLAQDAIEYIKNIRDENVLLNKTITTNWLENLRSCVVGDLSDDTEGCQIDTIEDSILSYSDDRPLLKDINNNFYGYKDGGAPTNFIRQIRIVNPIGSNVDEALINVLVRWDADIDNNVDVSTLIYNY
jgi:type II secretory pathway pseudopilin PulG